MLDGSGRRAPAGDGKSMLSASGVVPMLGRDGSVRRCAGGAGGDGAVGGDGTAAIGRGGGAGRGAAGGAPGRTGGAARGGLGGTGRGPAGGARFGDAGRGATGAGRPTSWTGLGRSKSRASGCDGLDGRAAAASRLAASLRVATRASGATPVIVRFRSAARFGGAGGGGTVSAPIPKTAPKTGLGPVRWASVGASTLNDVPHFGQRILSPLGGMRRSSTW